MWGVQLTEMNFQTRSGPRFYPWPFRHCLIPSRRPGRRRQ
ncbi:DUF6783 domain-containing protein [Hungatella hathewayi]